MSVKRYNPDPYCRCSSWNEAEDGCIVAAEDYNALLTEAKTLGLVGDAVATKLRDAATSKIRGANVHMVEIRPFVLYDWADELDACKGGDDDG
jgi:hypothetical protein